MHNMWLVARHEFRRMVFRRGFVLLTLAVPLGLLLLASLGFFVARMGENRQPVGYIDHSGTLDPRWLTELPDSSEHIELRPYPDRAAAIDDLEAEEIQAVVIFPATYPASLQTDLLYLQDLPSEQALQDLNQFVRLNLVADYPPEIATRLLEGPKITVTDITSDRKFSREGMINVILPFVASVFFFIATMSASGSMLQIVATEKENRTMELMLTSLTSNQLILGKSLGLLAGALAQLAVYGTALVLGLIAARPLIPWLQQAVVPWAYIFVMALFFLPAYALMAAIMVAVGSAVTELQQGQQIAGVLNLIFMLPLLFMVVIFENPASPIAVALSIFPLTAFYTISLRWGFGTIPSWQIGVSWLLLIATTAGMFWAAAKIFRLGMLRYGQALSFKAVTKALRLG